MKNLKISRLALIVSLGWLPLASSPAQDDRRGRHDQRKSDNQQQTTTQQQPRNNDDQQRRQADEQRRNNERQAQDNNVRRIASGKISSALKRSDRGQEQRRAQLQNQKQQDGRRYDQERQPKNRNGAVFLLSTLHLLIAASCSARPCRQLALSSACPFLIVAAAILLL